MHVKVLLTLNKIYLIHLKHIYWIYTICQYGTVELEGKLNLSFQHFLVQLITKKGSCKQEKM